MDFAPPFGRWLKQQRRELDLTQVDLAQLSGYSVFAVRKIESGYTRPSRQMAEKLATALGVAPESCSQFMAFARGFEFPHPMTTLPVPPTPLIGRMNDIATVQHALQRDDVRLLTLVGPPGVGKTRLALHLAETLGGAYADGVRLVALAPIGDPAQVGAAIAEVFGLRISADRPVLEHLKQYLRGKHLLLVLDNFEHLLSAAMLVAELLANAPRLKVLATSRATLNLSAEHTYPVPPLELPDLGNLGAVESLAKFPAVELFVHRAQTVKPGFTLTKSGAPAVAEICCRLDGLPLMIELAAAHVRMFTPQTILLRLDHHTGSALTLLTDGPRDLPAHQKTLRATIDWSYQLLSADEKKLFRCLGVFVGGCTLDAAMAVYGEDKSQIGDSKIPPGEAPICNTPSVANESLISNLRNLLDNSLLLPSEGYGGEPRFTMLETIREYALECLEQCGCMVCVRDRHMAYFTLLAEGSSYGGPDAALLTWAKRFDADSANMRSAVIWSQGEHADPLVSLRLVVGLVWFWISRSYPRGQYYSLTEMRGWVERALARCPDAPLRLRALALHRIAWCTGVQGDLPRGMEVMNQALTLSRELGDKRDLLIPLYAMGVGEYWMGDYARAQSYIDEHLGLARELGLQSEVGAGLGMLGLVALARGDVNGAVGLLENSLCIARELGLKWGATRTGHLGQSLRDLSVVRLQMGDPGGSAALAEEAVALSGEVGDLDGAAWAGLCLGYALLAQGKIERARKLLGDGLRHFRDIGSLQGILISVAELAETSYTLGERRVSTVLAGAAAAHLSALPATVPRMKPQLPICERIISTAHSRLTDPELTVAWAEGQAMTFEQMMEYALKQDGN